MPDGRYKAYRCPANVPTIYCGLTHGVKDGMIVTEAEGEAMLKKELWRYEDAVERLVTVDLNQNEFDACVLLVFNIGIGAFEKSTLLKLLNQGKRQAAAAQFGRWVNGGGKKLPGLVRRRAAEAALFLKPVEGTVAEVVTDEPSMPQKVEAEPEMTTIEAIRTSPTTKMTIGSIFMTIYGWWQSGTDFAMGVVKEAGPQIVETQKDLTPFSAILKMSAGLAFVIAMACLVSAILRQIAKRKAGTSV
jgi:lysozyme